MVEESGLKGGGIDEREYDLKSGRDYFGVCGDTLRVRGAASPDRFWGGSLHDLLAVTSEVYKTLSDKERLLYDEFYSFGLRLASRMEEIIVLLQKATAMDRDS